MKKIAFPLVALSLLALAACKKDETPEGAVDLGLSVYWAETNLGAISPNASGDYYAWGETQPKGTYDLENYKWIDGEGYTKYTKGGLNAERNDGKEWLEDGDNPVKMKLGGKWRMPTQAEWNELVNRCQNQWETREGVQGFCLIGLTGKTIFLPAVGYMKGVGLQDENTLWYWNAKRVEDWNAQCAHSSNQSPIKSDEVQLKYCGLPIRPVMDK